MMRRLAVTVLLTTLLVWIVCYVALWFYAGPGRPPERREVVIEQGDAVRIARGENPLEIPSTWSFRSGDVLVLDNRDSAIHVVGPWTVGPGQIVELTLRASVPSAFCSIHPDGVLSISVDPRRTDFAVTLTPTLLLGPPLGVVAYAVRQVFSRLEESDVERRVSAQAQSTTSR
ncbi:MAG: hypothetical protein GY745_18875 [Actinomycetia bacterium]|nr:hypothetical protein [Actinomycetes bacterium]MCP4087087.1 hypothetical protein [Actinomycetes bacterium]